MGGGDRQFRTEVHTNILLDHEYAPKLSEFGYSMMGPLSMSNDLIKSRKGSLIIQMLESTLIPLNFMAGLKQSKFRELPIRSPGIYVIFKCIKNGTVYDIIDPYLKGTIDSDCLQLCWQWVK
ncbi:receptor-like protein kinase FERONIA isoform X2 [Gossypium australe]|uniref:Receptor-like protein kinase FERONIA isoform X2 n=1 Tax=Gossypium australe TaxID=47621 RepID=A0A5B6W0M0_9ROSI|nr:receptor-like protein kinase FERONIA isoform X2 [Gossypium australe]